MAKLKNMISGTRMGDQGFTIVEFLIACALLSVLMAIMVKLFTLINYTYTTQNAAASVQQVVRTGIDIMTQNIRMAGFNPLQLAGVGILADSSADSIRFSYDKNADGIIDDENDADDNDEIVRYLHEDNQLKRQLGDGNRIGILDNVTDLTFTYLDENDQVTADSNAIKTVEISMTVSVPAGRRKTVSRTYATRVLCRNLGL
jgi:prepilin-type N-terminal cleavage/methylation domain-containing protein